MPPTWAASKNLGNPPHVDPRDGHRSYCQWYVQGQANSVKDWWFVFPSYGLVIELCDGVCISWDGRHAPHCTSVPVRPPNVDVYALWCSAHVSLASQLRLQHELMSVLRKRSLPSTHDEFEGRSQFRKGDRCLLYWRAGHHKIAKAALVKVKCVHNDGSVVVRDSSSDLQLSPADVHRYLTHDTSRSRHV